LVRRSLVNAGRVREALRSRGRLDILVAIPPVAKMPHLTVYFEPIVSKNFDMVQVVFKFCLKKIYSIRSLKGDLLKINRKVAGFNRKYSPWRVKYRSGAIHPTSVDVTLTSRSSVADHGPSTIREFKHWRA
jgi:hypothetical protein